MIKQFLHKSFSILLALLVLFSTVSFTVEKHFCGDVLIDVSVFSEAQKCDMGSNEMEQQTVKKMSCCKDEIEVVKGQDELKFSSFEDLHFEQQQFIACAFYAYINLFESIEKQCIPHKDYSPPNLVADIQVLDQVFII
ncbi:HYC_CC_PP family protein [Thalassobellus citreus]|uniref:HYC_CC_PP family protein n=1 Tax=Thalassobellus citreus TaxID=3367752 RepID=UPI0037A85852